MRLDRLFRPRSVAVIGGGWGVAVVRGLQAMGFAGEIWPVHPTRDEVAGLRTYADIDALPGAPDAAFIGVNRHLTLAAVAALARRGAGGAVCFASGFAETGDRALSARLVAAADGMPILGPNCYGFLNYLDGAALWPDQHGGQVLGPEGRGVAILTQSSNIALNLTMQARGLPLAYVITLGNQAQTGMAAVTLALLDDPRVTAIGLHIEGFEDLRGYEALALAARAAGKPVIALKVGRSEAARQAGISHTASMSGDGAAAEAFLARLGMGGVLSLPVFLEALKLAHVTGLPASTAITSMSCSGGEAGLIADSAMGTDIRFLPVTDARRKAAAAALGPMVTIGNPLDYHTFIWDDGPAMRAAFGAFVAAEAGLNLLVLDFPRADRCTAEAWEGALDAFAAALAVEGASGAVVATLPETLPEAWAERAIALGIAPLAGLDDALAAVSVCAGIRRAWDGPVPAPILGPRPDRPTRTLAEDAAKGRLAAAGLPVPRGQVVKGDAAALAVDPGFPLALKALGLAHKSDRDGVRLGIGDHASLQEAMAALSPVSPRLYAERMVEDGVAELLVGITCDPVLGPVMTLGAGGVLVELLRDTETLVLPIGRGDVMEALGRLRIAPLLEGFRGRAGADREALAEAILGLAEFAEREAGLRELEVNPLIACADGAWIADTLMVE